MHRIKVLHVRGPLQTLIRSVSSAARAAKPRDDNVELHEACRQAQSLVTPIRTIAADAQMLKAK
jgi:hypothetical protein